MKSLSSLTQKLAIVGLVSVVFAGSAIGADKKYGGITLTLASQNDQFAAVLAALAPKFTEETGATVKVDILDYGSLLTKTTTDFVGGTGGYDLVTMDIVWSGQYAENNYTCLL